MLVIVFHFLIHFYLVKKRVISKTIEYFFFEKKQDDIEIVVNTIDKHKIC
jgi:hypothetical protein